MSGTPLIHVTSHAQQQARARHSAFWRNRGVDGIYGEVASALAEGRRAKTTPRWATMRARRPKMKGYGVGAYVWNAAGTRCYALRRTREGGVDRWVVVTVLAQVENRVA